MKDARPDISPGAPIEWECTDGFVDYDEAVQRMESRVQAIREGRKAELVWLLQHPPLYTAGTSAKLMDLLDADRFPVHLTGRGGEYTYHGPGQRVVYVMLDLKPRGGDVRGFVHLLEQWVIDALRDFGVRGERRADRIGVWIAQDDGREEKIAAVGVRVRKWVTYHGIAINVSPDLSHYSGIVPCGISEHGVTSLEALGIDAGMDDMDAALRRHFDASFALPETTGAA